MLYYLLSPEFQIVNTAGKPCTGYLEVYIHGTRHRYYCASDFDGTLHPFQVPLDSLGSNVVLADDSHAYDVYIYNRYGSLLMSRYNVHPSSGGSMGGVITSSDGSITVTPTQDGYDLSVTDGKAATFRAAADSLHSDGYFYFRKIEGEGDAIYLDNGTIRMDDGWYHFSATVKLSWTGSNVNETSAVRLYSGATYDVIDFDYSYNHSDTVVLDGDIWIGAYSTHFISFGRNFSLGVTGMRQGMTAELIDCDLHSIIGQGVGGGGIGEKNIHRLLRYYTDAQEADENHPVGDWLHDLDAIDLEDPSGHPMVTADQLFEWYEAGQIFDLYESDADGITDWSAVYRLVTWQDQSDWWSQDAPVPGKACRLEFYRAGISSVPNRVGLIAYIRYKDEDYMRLYQIKPGQDIWMMDLQEELPYYGSSTHNGEFLRVKADGSGLEWVAIDLSDYVTETDLQTALSGKQDTLTAGSNITIQNNVISASAAPQVQSNWTENDSSSVSYILNKPTELPAAIDNGKELIAGSNITLTSTLAGVVISASGGSGGSTPWTYHEDTSFSITVTAEEATRNYFERLVPISSQDILNSDKDFVMIYQCHVEADSSDPPSIPDMTPIEINVYNYPNHNIDEITGIFTTLGGVAIQSMHSHGSVVLGNQMLSAGRLFSVCFPRNTLTTGDKFNLTVRAVYIELTGVN